MAKVKVVAPPQETVYLTPGEKLATKFRVYVDTAIVFGGIPSLVLNIVFIAIAVAFATVPVLPTVMGLLVTLLLAFTGIVLLVRYIDVTVQTERHAIDPTEAVWPGMLCAVLVTLVIGCLVTAGQLIGWQYVLLALEMVLVGYQTWRAFVGREED